MPISSSSASTQRHLPPLAVALVELLAELVEHLGGRSTASAAQDLDAAHDLLQHGAAERRPVAGLDHVELEEARQLDRGGQLLAGLGHRRVAVGRRAGAAGVERRQGVARPRQALGAGAVGRAGGGAGRSRSWIASGPVTGGERSETRIWLSISSLTYSRPPRA